MRQATANSVRAPEVERILHCLRAPVGGLFRHVFDLATAQAERGHRVGVICADSGDGLTEQRLLALAPSLALGLHRLPIGRDLGLDDFNACLRVKTIARDLGVNVIHGHGAKGGAYARLATRFLRVAKNAPRCFYTPHGGSLHYPSTSLSGLFYGALERRLERWTAGILFESQYAADRYMRQIGPAACATEVVLNGVNADEFEPILPAPDAADFVFVGELRFLKGVDVALEALSIVNKTHKATAVIVGSGPDRARFMDQARTLGISANVRFPGPMRAREGFGLGRVLLVPSRAESLPYIVLEAAAAGLPILATSVGGIPEIIPSQCGPLLPPGNVQALATAMLRTLDNPTAITAKSLALRDVVRQRFTVSAMATAVTRFYAGTEAARMIA